MVVKPKAQKLPHFNRIHVINAVCLTVKNQPEETIADFTLEDSSDTRRSTHV